MTRITPEELRRRLLAQAELGSTVREQARQVAPVELPPGGAPAERLPPAGDLGKSSE